MKNSIIDGEEVAPQRCIVCGKNPPSKENSPGWTYISGSKPLGAITCSKMCLRVALQRNELTGRVDLPKMRVT
jgi:hypothetical protein